MMSIFKELGNNAEITHLIMQKNKCVSVYMSILVCLCLCACACKFVNEYACVSVCN